MPLNEKEALKVSPVINHGFGFITSLEDEM